MANDIDPDPFRRTIVLLKESGTKICRKDKMLWIGSCFVESLAPYLLKYQYKATLNPFGVVFHPLVLLRLLELEPAEFHKQSFEKDGVWHNYWLGNPFHGRTREELNSLITKTVQKTLAALNKTSWLVLTWGTAFWYEHNELGLVGKCHKQPQSNFQKRRSEPDEISLAWIEKIKQLRQSNPDLKILLTLSPVRHTRDGLEGNALSKSTLRLAIQKVVDSLPGVYYFPSFEIVMDELRDYRFFESDLIHPNTEAIQYIWERFSTHFFPAPEIKTNQTIQAIGQLESHRNLVPYGKEYENRMAEQKKRRTELDALIHSELTGF